MGSLRAQHTQRCHVVVRQPLLRPHRASTVPTPRLRLLLPHAGGATIGPLCGATGPKTWAVSCKWSNAAGSSAAVAGAPVAMPQCCASVGSTCTIDGTHAGPRGTCCADAPAPLACVPSSDAAGAPLVCATAPAALQFDGTPTIEEDPQADPPGWLLEGDTVGG